MDHGHQSDDTHDRSDGMAERIRHLFSMGLTKNAALFHERTVIGNSAFYQ
jgi:hypothetical protein